MINYNVDKAVNEFLDFIEISDNSKKTYKRILIYWFKYLHINRVKVTNPDKTHFRQFKATIIKKYSCNTVNLYLSALRQFYKFLDNIGYYKNITEGTSNVKYNHEISKEPLNDNQVVELLTSIPKDTFAGLRDYTMINLMINTGLRRIEINRLKLTDIIPDRNQIKIQRKGSISLITFGVGIDLMNCLQDYIIYRKEFINENTDNSLFISVSRNNKGNRLSKENISAIIKSRLNAIGLTGKEYTAHSLRHTFASLALNDQQPINKISATLGHSNIKTTSIYLEALQRHIVSENEIVSAISRVIKKKAQELNKKI